MIDWIAVLILVVLVIPAGIFSINATYDIAFRLSQKSGEKLPDKRIIAFASVAQILVIAFTMAVVGFLLQDTTKFQMPFIQSVSSSEIDFTILGDQISSTFLLTLLATILFLALYYFYYRRRFSEEEIAIIEGVRDQIGLAGRIFNGGIFEEILFRWGILSIVFWLTSFLVPIADVSFWIANTITVVIFGLAHLPAIKGMGLNITPKIIESAIVLNAVVGLVFGWALYNFGLEAAFFSHTFLHLIWYPIEKQYGKNRMTIKEAQTHLNVLNVE